MKKFRFHLLGLAHLPASRTFMSCAFTQKNLKLAKMLTSLGHEVFFYGAESSDVKEYCNSDNFHFIQTHTLNDIRADYGEGYNLPDSNGIGYSWRTKDFKTDFRKQPKNPSTLKFYDACIKHINSIKKNDDFILLSQGVFHKPISDAVKLFLTCEPGIGYKGSIKGVFRAFESPYIQNFTYGSENPFKTINGSYYDRVIPNYFDPSDITYKNQKKNYYLFIGRMVKSKGMLTAYLTTKAIGAKLIIAGQAGSIDSRGYLINQHSDKFEIPNDSDWEYIGFADVNKRKELMAGAIATFTPTEYLEAFAGTHIESMLSGTPPITTDFGVYSYTIPDYLNGQVGFRCNTLQDFVDAANNAKSINHKFVRKYAERFLMDNVSNEFQKWFEDLYNLYESAKIPGKKGWHRLKQND